MLDFAGVALGIDAGTGALVGAADDDAGAAEEDVLVGNAAEDAILDAADDAGALVGATGVDDAHATRNRPSNSSRFFMLASLSRCVSFECHQVLDLIIK
jgi:hypothetical protein